MKEWFTARELAGMPGMPKHSTHVARKLAKTPSREGSGRGGPREWHISKFSADVQFNLVSGGFLDETHGSGVAYPASIGDGAAQQGKVEKTGALHRGRAYNSEIQEDLPQGVGLHSGGLESDAPGLAKQSRLATPGKGKASLRHGNSTALPEKYKLTEHQISNRWLWFDALPEKKKDRAKRALASVVDFKASVAAGMLIGAAQKAVAAKYQTGPATIDRRLKAIDGLPDHVWLAFLADHNHGRTARAAFDLVAQEDLKADWLRRERPSMAACIARLRRTAAAQNWVIPKADRTLQRFLNDIPRAVRVYKREGEKALAKLSPDHQRDKTLLGALQIINGDGYMHNVWIAFPDGEIRRAKTWFWQDVYSAKILAWRTDKTEHTDVIRLSFGDVVEKFGIPDGVLVDNTRAAANKTMSGGVRHRYRFKVREEEPLGVFALLGVHNSWAQPEHGQSKPIERAFGIGGIGEYVDKAPDFAGAWTGGSPLDKPDYDGKTRAVPLADLQRVIEREVAEFNSRAGRRSRLNHGRSHDEVFNESFKAITVKRATEAQRRLWLLATEPVTANRKDGAITLDAGRIVRSDVAPTYANRYWAPAMVELAGKKVVARFDPQRLHEGVHIYTADGRYVCFAECHAPAGFNDANAGREHNRARRSYVKAQKQLAASEVRMDILEVAKALPGVTNPPQAASGVVIAAPKVIRPEFRPKYEIPQRSEAENAEMAAFEAEATAPSARPLELLDDHQRYSLWKQLQARVSAGEELEERMAAFYAGFADTARLFDEINTDLRGQAGSNAA